jgi:hypothetical protein
VLLTFLKGGTGDDFDGEKKFEFEIVTPERKRGWMFATKSEADRQVICCLWFLCL